MSIRVTRSASGPAAAVARAVAATTTMTTTAARTNGAKRGTKKRAAPGTTVEPSSTTAAAAVVDLPSTSMLPPATPSPVKRARTSPTRKTKQDAAEDDDDSGNAAVPATPTPLEAKAMSGLATPDGKTKLPPPTSASRRRSTRPANPHVTNAPLATPGGTKHVAYRRQESASPTRRSSNSGKDEQPGANTKAKVKTKPETETFTSMSVPAQPAASSSAPNLPAPSATTDDILAKACAHLRAADPRLGPVIDAHPCPLWTPAALAEPVDPFKALVSSILGQQVSGAAAASIKRKFILLFVSEAELESNAKRFPTPAQVAVAELATLRTAGLSGRKAEYVKGLAEKFAGGELTAEFLVTAGYEELFEKLIAVRGLGRWSVEMFACFALKRMDVFSTGDLGVQRGLAALVGKDVKKLKGSGKGKWKYMGEQEMLEQAEKFAPYRSLFMWYCWRVEDVNVDAIQNN